MAEAEADGAATPSSPGPLTIISNSSPSRQASQGGSGSGSGTANRLSSARHGNQALIVQACGDASGRSHIPVAAATMPMLMSEIGMGRFQVGAIVLILGFPIADASEILCMTTLSLALKIEWDLTDAQASLMPAASFAGLALGTYLSGAIADSKGRRFVMVVSYSGMAAMGAVASLATGYRSMSAFRFVNGMFCGMGVPASHSLLTEITPQDWRPAIFTIYLTFFVVGEIFAIISLLIWMPDLADPTYWKIVSNWSSLPSICWLGFCIAWMQESAHWLAANGRIAEATVVLRQMASQNGRMDVLVRMGLDGSARPERPQDEAAEETSTATDSPWQVLKILFSGDNLMRMMVFSNLCVMGNFATYGMTSYWPEMLHSMGHSSSSPAWELLCLRSTGFVCFAANFFIVQWRFVGHRLAIAMSSLFGAVACIVLSTTNAFVKLVAAGMVMMCGTLAYATVQIFVSESFPTKIRASAVGCCICIGRIGSISAPLLLATLGEFRFLLIGVAFFFLSSTVVGLVPETKCVELTDFNDDGAEVGHETSEEMQNAIRRGSGSGGLSPEELERINARVAEMGNDDEVASGISTDSDEDGPLSGSHRDGALHMFPQGTIGAKIEYFLFLAGLGVMPGAAVTFYLASIGYFTDLLNDETLFSLQIGAVLSGNLLLTIVHWTVEKRLDERFGIQQAMVFRLVVCNFLLAVLIGAVAFAQQKIVVLALGFSIGSASGLVLVSGSELASIIDAASVPWVQAGRAIGAAVPVGIIPIVMYRPGCPLPVRLCFFAVPAGICLLGGLGYWWYHRRLARLKPYFDRHPSPRRWKGGALQRLHFAYRGLEACEDRGLEAWSLRQLWETRNRLLLMVSTVNSFFGSAATVFLFAFIPRFGTPQEAQTLFLYKVVGDVAGRLASMPSWHGQLPKSVAPGSPRRSCSHEKTAWRWASLLTVLSTVRLMGVFMLTLPLVSPDDVRIARIALDGTSPVLLWSIFWLNCGNSFVASCFDALVPSAMPMALRRTSARWQRLVQYLGFGCGLLLCWSSFAPFHGASVIVLGDPGLRLDHARDARAAYASLPETSGAPAWSIELDAAAPAAAPAAASSSSSSSRSDGAAVLHHPQQLQQRPAPAGELLQWSAPESLAKATAHPQAVLFRRETIPAGPFEDSRQRPGARHGRAALAQAELAPD